MKIMEIVWGVVGLFSLGAGIHAFAQQDMKRSIVFFVMVVISFFIFTLRIRLRRIHEKKTAQKETDKQKK